MRADKFDFHPRILIFCRQMGNSEPECIGTILLDDIQRIDAIAFRLRHSFPIAV